jgi:hypothetical protein
MAAWSGVKEWLDKNPDRGCLAEEPYETTFAEISADIKARRRLFEDLSEANRKSAEVAMLSQTRVLNDIAD